MPSQSDLEHLLRRTEYIARAERVSELSAMSLPAAVANILAVPADPGSATFLTTETWQQGEELTHFWLDRMAHDSPRPIQEKMGFFWHGHFCSDLSKVGSGALMREQIDLFRTGALSNLRTLATIMSTQVAMLRYLDNNGNKKTSPNQNFARENLELFLLGVGNYTEADVEAATAAWTGHTDNWETDAYVWRADWHDASPKQFLGVTINTGADQKQHGYETIHVVLDNGVVPAGASVASNRGRPTREVAAEFLSTKLWHEFAGTNPPADVIAAMRVAALSNNFEIKPWLTAMLTHSAFYTAEVKQGRVRSPVEYVVALLHATGRRSKGVTPLWSMDGMGQRPLFPPNVSGWKHNGFWINASAMSKRIDTARHLSWVVLDGYWGDGGHLELRGGTVTRSEVVDVGGYYRDRPIELLDRFTQLMGVTLTPSSHAVLSALSQQMTHWQRGDLVPLIFMAPDLHVA